MTRRSRHLSRGLRGWSAANACGCCSPPSIRPGAILTRRDLGAVARQPRVQQIVLDFATLADVADELAGGPRVLCARDDDPQGGFAAAFPRGGRRISARLAELTLARGARHFSLVSALGASRTSPFFYSRVKGELEEALRAMHWPSLCLVRPSVIAGARAESRPFERLAGHALQFAPRTWRPVPAQAIAAAMVNTALRCAARSDGDRIPRHRCRGARQLTCVAACSQRAGPRCCSRSCPATAETLLVVRKTGNALDSSTRARAATRLGRRSATHRTK